MIAGWIQTNLRGLQQTGAASSSYPNGYTLNARREGVRLRVQSCFIASRVPRVVPPSPERVRSLASRAYQRSSSLFHRRWSTVSTAFASRCASGFLSLPTVFSPQRRNQRSNYQDRFSRLPEVEGLPVMISAPSPDSGLLVLKFYLANLRPRAVFGVPSRCNLTLPAWPCRFPSLLCVSLRALP